MIFEIPENAVVQLLDKNNKRTQIYNTSNEWIKSEGPRIKELITIPWNYKQIIHDLNKLNKLEKGEYSDLSQIGIVTENTPKKTWPDINNLYISKTLETKRLITFKYRKNEEISII